MRILSINEIPEEFKIEINQSGLDRYALFAEEINNTYFISQDSSKKAVGILVGLQGLDFPYKDLRIGKPTLSHWKKLNRATHMGVLVIDTNNVIHLVEGILDMSLVPMNSFDDMPNLII